MVIKNETFKDEPILNWFKEELIRYHKEKYGEKCIVVHKKEPDNN